jgi:hypothetical protein
MSAPAETIDVINSYLALPLAARRMNRSVA